MSISDIQTKMTTPVIQKKIEHVRRLKSGEFCF